MMPIETIRSLSREAALRSRRLGLIPFVIDEHDAADLFAGRTGNVRLPFIGDRCPRGWRRFDLWTAYKGHRSIYEWNGYGAVFVDTSGFGLRGEAALCQEDFLAFLALASRDHGYRLGWALVEQGQFQGHVAAFTKGGRHAG